MAPQSLTDRTLQESDHRRLRQDHVSTGSPHPHDSGLLLKQLGKTESTARLAHFGLARHLKWLNNLAKPQVPLLASRVADALLGL